MPSNNLSGARAFRASSSPICSIFMAIMTRITIDIREKATPIQFAIFFKLLESAGIKLEIPTRTSTTPAASVNFPYQSSVPL